MRSVPTSHKRQITGLVEMRQKCHKTYPKSVAKSSSGQCHQCCSAANFNDGARYYVRHQTIHNTTDETQSNEIYGYLFAESQTENARVRHRQQNKAVHSF
jgi:hypothetical protein